MNKIETPKQTEEQKEINDLMFLNRVARSIWGKKTTVGKYSHSGKYIINLESTILFNHEINKLEQFAEMSHFQVYGNVLSMVVVLRENAKDE